MSDSCSPITACPPSELVDRLQKIADAKEKTASALSAQDVYVSPDDEKRAEATLSALAAVPGLPLSTLFALDRTIDVFRRSKNDAVVAAATKILEKEFADPRHLIPLVETLLKTPTWWDGENLALSAAHNLLIKVRSDLPLPPLQDLLNLAQKYPRLESPVAVAVAARGGDLTPYQKAELVLILQRLSKSDEVKQRLMFVQAAKHLPEAADFYLPPLLKDSHESVRLAVYRALADLKAPVALFQEGLKDSSPAIHVTCARHLAKHGSKDVFQKLLQEESDEETLLLAARSLEVSLKPDEAIPLLFNRLRRPAPESLLIAAIRMVEKAGFEPALGPVYQLFLLHKSPQVRHAALSALQSMRPKMVFKEIPHSPSPSNGPLPPPLSPPEEIKVPPKVSLPQKPPRKPLAPQVLGKIVHPVPDQGFWLGKFGPYHIEADFLGADEWSRLRVQAKREGEEEWSTIYFDDSCPKEYADVELDTIVISPLPQDPPRAEKKKEAVCPHPLSQLPPWLVRSNAVPLGEMEDGRRYYFSVMTGFDLGAEMTSLTKAFDFRVAAIPVELKFHVEDFLLAPMISPEVGWSERDGAFLRGRIGLSADIGKKMGWFGHGFGQGASLGYSVANLYFFAEKSLETDGDVANGFGLDLITSSIFVGGLYVQAQPWGEEKKLMLGYRSVYPWPFFGLKKALR